MSHEERGIHTLSTVTGIRTQPTRRASAVLRALATAALVALALPAGLCRAADPAPQPADSARQYREAHNLMTSADEARDAGRLDEATILYETALKGYRVISEHASDAQSEMVRFQSAYCEDQLAALKKAVSQLEWSPPVVTGEDEIPSHLTSTPAIGPTAASAPVRSPKTVAAALAEGRRLVRGGDAEAARSVLLDAMSYAPDNREVRLLLGVVQCQAGRCADAVRILEPLVAEEPTNAFVHVCLGAAYVGTGRPIDATDEMKDALALNPSLSEAHYNLAKILLENQPPDLDQVRRYYRKSLALGGQRDPKLDGLLEAGSGEPDAKAEPPGKPAEATVPASPVGGEAKQDDKKAEPEAKPTP